MGSKGQEGEEKSLSRGPVAKKVGGEKMTEKEKGI